MNELLSSPSFPAAQQSLPSTAGDPMRLRLFVAGNTPRSSQTIQTLRQMCDERIQGQYQLEIIDIYQQPALAREAQIIATPTLMKLAPKPKKIMIGTLAQTERVLASLGLGG